MYSGQQIDDQKARFFYLFEIFSHKNGFLSKRFKKIATVAATRVETMRDLLVNWNFFIETKVAFYFCEMAICVANVSQFCHICGSVERAENYSNFVVTLLDN